MGLWNSIKFNGSMTKEDYERDLQKEVELEKKALTQIDVLKERIKKYDDEIKRLKPLGDAVKLDKKVL